MDWQKLDDDLGKIVQTSFATRDGQKVPEASDISLGNDAVELDAAILYADIDGSTNMAASQEWDFSAKVYKMYLHAACRVIREQGGTIVGFDGDRVMAVFIGGAKNSKAAKSALGIKYACRVINKKIQEEYPKTTFVLRQCVGIDRSKVRAVRTGIRGSNDLVWVGTAPNYAAKMTELREGDYSTYISAKVYQSLLDDSKFTKGGKDMWEAWKWTATNKLLYRSKFWWKF